MKKFLLPSLLLSYFSLSAQMPYSTLKVSTPQYFRGWSPLSASFVTQTPIAVLHFSSAVQQGADSVFTGFVSPFDTSQTASTCMEDDGKSWFGTTAIRKPDMREVYTNILNDSIYYDPLAGVGKTFRMYDYPGGDYINATVDSLVFTYTPAFSDSMKYISMQRFDAFGVPVADSVNGKQIIVSRDSGWVSFFEANYFPATWIPKNRVAWQPIPDRAEVYDFNPGDVFQYRLQRSSAFGGMNYPPVYQEVAINGMQFFNGGDSVEYYTTLKTMSFIFNSIPFPHLDTLFSVVTDTLRYGSLHSPFWTVWPMESYYLPTPYPEVAYTLLDTGYCSGGLIQTSVKGSFSYYQPLGCYVTPFEPIIQTNTYAKGLGEIFNSNDARSIGGDLLERNLIWSSRNGNECGQHTTFTGLQENVVRSFSLSPNPASGLLRVTPLTDERIQAVIISTITGARCDAVVESLNNDYLINIAHLSPGLYMIRVDSEKGSSTQRFVKD